MCMICASLSAWVVPVRAMHMAPFRLNGFFSFRLRQFSQEWHDCNRISSFFSIGLLVNLHFAYNLTFFPISFSQHIYLFIELHFECGGTMGRTVPIWGREDVSQKSRQEIRTKKFASKRNENKPAPAHQQDMCFMCDDSMASAQQ